MSQKTTATSAGTTPVASEIDNKEDWTQIKDPIMKKRIQNRIAQRTYRRRLKLRLDELEKLRNKERQKNQQWMRPQRDSVAHSLGSSADISFIDHLNDCSDDSVDCNDNKDSTCYNNGNLGPIRIDNICGKGNLLDHVLSEMDERCPWGAAVKLPPHHTPYDHLIEGRGISSFRHPSELPVLSPQHESPPFRNVLPPAEQYDSEGSMEIPRGLILDCLNLQAQLLKKFQNSQPKPDCRGAYSQGENIPNLLGSLNSVAEDKFPDAVDPDSLGVLGTSFGPKFDNWGPDDTPQDAWLRSFEVDGPSDTSPSGMAGFGSSKSPMDSGPTLDHSASTSLSNTDSVEKRCQLSWNNIEAAGFENIEALVPAYYCAKFSETSPLAAQQRSSRSKRLPGVIAELLKATGGWTAWERRGFYQEILKSAEMLLKSEATGTPTAPSSPSGASM